LARKITKLVVGLGNPGKQYRHTRHNIGFKVVLATRKKLHSSPWQIECNSLCSKKNDYLLALPQTFMNKSGIAVKCLKEQLQLPLSNLLIVVDDIDLPLGKIRLRKSGSSGGHNGLKSIMTELGTENFKRLRFGVGSRNSSLAKKYLDTKEFVLSQFEEDEVEIVENKIAVAVDLLILFYMKTIKKC